MKLNEDGTFHAIRHDGTRDYDAEMKFAEALAVMASRAKSEASKIAVAPRQILSDPRGISTIAKSVVSCDMDLCEAEYRVFMIASVAKADTGQAIELLHRQITRYETEAPRVSSAIRVATRPMMEAKKQPDDIKKRAAEINKLGILTDDEVREVLRSEYLEYKANLSPQSV